MIRLIAGWAFIGVAYASSLAAAYDTWFSRGPKAGILAILFFIPILIFMIVGTVILLPLVDGLINRFWFIFVLPAIIIIKALLLLFGR